MGSEIPNVIYETSMKRPKKQGQKSQFFASIFAHFLLQNHYIWWLTRLICP